MTHLSPHLPVKPSFASGLVTLSIHTLVAMLAIPLITGLLDGIVANYPSIHQIFDKGGIFNPATWLLGLIAGFAINRRLSGRSACWTWFGGVLWMLLGVIQSLHFYHLLDHSFGTCSAFDNIENAFVTMDSGKCRGASEILDGLIFTFPSLNAISYSAGAWIGLMRGRQMSLQHDDIRTQ